ncbi:MAG: response regulator transcription factor [Oscillospiraceae bacterium]
MIYYVEDDSSIRELVIYTFRNSGFESEGFSCADEFYRALECVTPELVLLDIMLPGEDGVTILKKLRTGISTREIPVILVSAKNTEYDKIEGLDLGADDYVSKPFGMMELVSRTRAVLRRYRGHSEQKLLKFCDIVLDLRSRRTSISGQPIELTAKEFDLLALLIHKGGAVASRDEILGQIWGYGSSGETRTVDVHVRTLRAKLGRAGKAIETVRGFGYRIGELK